MHESGDVEFVKSPSSDPLALTGPLARLDRIAGGIAELQAAVAALRARTRRPGGGDLALMRMAALTAARARSDAAMGSAAFAVAVAREELRLRLAGQSLPAPGHPVGLSVIYAAGGVEACLAALPWLAAGLRASGGELLLADSGIDPQVAMLPGLVRHLRLLDGGGDLSLARNLCAVASHAETLLLLAPGAGVGSVGVMDRGTDRAWLPDEVWVGRRALDSLARWGVGLGPTQPGGAGLDLMVPRALWRAAGGLDPLMQDGGGLELADLCLKLRLLGARLVPLADSGGWSPQGAMPSAQQAAAAFRARWGEIAVEIEEPA